ncbi:hypothetical protein V5799_010763 [Amblyomma americanum]|uniref:Cytochrome n=1 Tax=Amblyomma americanum TaxID=6943 RepID=A0AAQ4EJ71_AMBAM
MQLKKDRIAVMEEWIGKYGKVFGYYKGTVPHLVISDVAMIKECFIKESSVFYDRPRAALVIKPYNKTLIFLRGQEWKHVRSVLNPSFSAAKMKLMTPIISRCVGDFMDVLDRKADRGEAVDVMQASQGLSLDVIANCALAWQLDGQKKPDNPLAQLLRGILYEAETAFTTSFVAFPFLGKCASWLYRATLHYRRTWEIIDNVRSVVQARRRSQKAASATGTGGGGRRVDILQLLLDAQEQDHEASAEPNAAALAPIDDDTLLANSLLFLLAGFETTASTLSFILHLMAQHQLEQDKVYEELIKRYPEDEDLDYGQLQELECLDMFVKEALRLYPPVVLLVSRHCRVDTTILGQLIPAGCEVLAPVWHLHHDPQLWPDPFHFKPERFAPEASKDIHPGAYMPFGIGPKSCIGNRFALLELKAALCRLLRRYQVLACSRMEDPIDLIVQTVLVSPKTPIQVMLQRRAMSAADSSS